MRSRRTQRISTQNLALPVIPFLAIMLGLMGVMALTTIGIAVEQRNASVERGVVQLSDIPTNFIPFHLRCSGDKISWLDDKNLWGAMVMEDFIQLFQRDIRILQTSNRDAIRFHQFLQQKVQANRALSFSRQQNTMIVWVEPDGVEMASLLEYFITINKIPLRMGLLPILPGEEIRDKHEN